MNNLIPNVQEKLATNPNGNSKESESLKMLPLVNRYHAAWMEHSTRITLRQNVVQIYLATVFVVFGFFLADKATRFTPQMFVISVTALTASATALVWLHNRTLQNLGTFLTDCELRASKLDPNFLPYFRDPKELCLHSFHSDQRSIHRAVIMIIFGITNGTALFLVRDQITFIAGIVISVIIFMDACFAFQGRHRERVVAQHPVIDG